MTKADIVIVGGGLAGLAAAEALSRHRPDLKLLLLESKRVCGGRAGSYHDPDTDQEIDYCQHAAMGCCTNFLDLIERCKLGECFERVGELSFLHPQSAPSRFSANPLLPPPLHLLGTINAQRYLSRKQKREIKRGLWKLMRTGPSKLGSRTAGEWLTGAGQSEATKRDFWDVILVSALGEQTDQVSMAAARKVMIDGFAAARGASDVLIPKHSLAELFGRRLIEHLRQRGVTIQTGEAVKAITSDGRVVTATGTHHGAAVVCAVPWHAIGRLFADWQESERSRLPHLDQYAQIPSSSITGIHLWFDRPITDQKQAVMVGTLSQWLFNDPCNDPCRDPSAPPSEQSWESDSEASDTCDDGSGIAKQYYYQVVVSASADVAKKDKQAIVDQVVSELRQAFPDARKATLMRYRLVTDPKSVFSIRPDVETIRPPATTSIPWLHLAGDWTRTGWPATMEGAVISGRQAALSVLKSQLLPGCDGVCHAPSVVSFGMPRGWLAKFLIRSG